MSAITVEPLKSPAHFGPIGDGLYEVVYGQVVEKEMSFFATWIASGLIAHMRPFVASNRLGTAVQDAIFILDPVANLRRRPDVAYMSAATWPFGKPFPETGDLTVCPDLAVEVTSPNDLFDDVNVKVDEYFRHGCRQVWLVVPKTKRVHIYTNPTTVRVLTTDDTLSAEELIPGWSMPVEKLFTD